MKNKFNKTASRKAENKIISELKLPVTEIILQAVIFTLSAVIAYIADVKTTEYYIFSIVSLSTGSFLNGFVSGRETRKKGLLNGIIYTLPSVVFYNFISLIANGFKADYVFLILSFIIPVIFSAIGGILSVNIRLNKRVKSRR